MGHYLLRQVFKVGYDRHEVGGDRGPYSAGPTTSPCWISMKRKIEGTADLVDILFYFVCFFTFVVEYD
jgi:hypothetical protein